MKNHRRTLLLIVAGLAFGAMLLMNPTTASLAVQDDAPLVASSAASFVQLASGLNEQPTWRTWVDASAAETPTCGQSGECNFITCPEPHCQADQTVSCSCTATSERCKDAWPWSTSYAVYSCDCRCNTHDPPPPGPQPAPNCVVYNPFDNTKCIVGKPVDPVSPKRPTGPMGDHAVETREL